MPEWSSNDHSAEFPGAQPESWTDIFRVLNETQKKMPTSQMFEELAPPERPELEHNLAKFVANLLAERVFEDPRSISKLPNPQLLVHATALGVLAGLIYAHAQHVATHNQEEETKE